MRTFSTLQIALGLSIAVHAVLLTVRFVDPERFNRAFQDTPLEVILVNARSNERANKAEAKAIAQFTLAGGGDLDKGRATSPLPPSALSQLGDADHDTQRKIEAMAQQQTQLLTQIKKQLASMPAPEARAEALSPAQAEQEARRRQLVKVLGEIEKRINEENARPKKRYISPATMGKAHAVYYDTLRRKIEDRGTQNFPELAGRKIYGALVMAITINFDGRVLATEVMESSGNRLLDRRAEAIVRSPGSYGPFTAEMRREADQIVVVSRFNFMRDETLETKLTDRPG